MAQNLATYSRIVAWLKVILPLILPGVISGALFAFITSFDEVVVAAMRNPQKGEGLFGLDEREQMIKESVAHLPNASVTMFSTLVVDLARELGVNFIVKGLRAVSDFENELQMAQMNNAVSGVHTLFIPSASRSSFLASKFIREIAEFGGDVSSMVPESVATRIKERNA